MITPRGSSCHSIIYLPTGSDSAAIEPSSTADCSNTGADLKAATGTPILAANAGKVLLIGDFFFNGKSVFVDHGMGVLTMYLHLSEISVTEGQLLERGEIVGLAGATGRVTGPHLHWGARVGGARVDPFSLPGIAGKDTAAASADRE